MRKTRWIEILIGMMPIKLVQDYLIRRFLMTDETYQRKLAGLEEVRGVLIDSGELMDMISLWPKVRNELRSGIETRSPGIRAGWKWALQGLGLCLVLVLGIWIIRHSQPERTPAAASSPGNFQIQSIRLENKPATTFLFQPNDSKFIMVWAEKIS